MAWAALGHSAEASGCCRRDRVILRLLKSCFEAQSTHQCWAKKAVKCRVPTNQVKPRGQKRVCLRNIKQVPVFLNRSLEIYFQKGTEGTSPCILSITASAQFPQRRKRDGGGRHWWTWGRTCLWGLQSASFWYLHTSGTLFMQNNEHHVLSIVIAGNTCKSWGCTLPFWMAEDVGDLQGHW